MADDDESTPLLRRTDDEEQGKREVIKETPLPWGQFSLVLALHLTEPMCSQVIYPFLPQLIRETGITKGDEKKVGYYVGIMQSVFFASEAMMVFHWSRISDRIGRKPVILTCLAGLALSMFFFGLARSFLVLLIVRSLNGALNGNISVIKSLVAELTDSTNIARASAYQPISWCTGGTIGPLIGGALSHPTERFPTFFGGNRFLKTYPYFLPCAIAATYTALAWLVALFFLKETNQTGFTFRKLFLRLWTRLVSRHSPDAMERDPGLEPRPSLSSAPPFRKLLTRPVLLSSTGFALFSLLEIAFRAIQPTFFAAPRSLGGLGLPPHEIGNFLAFLGIANGLFQVAFFTHLTKRLGTKRVYLIGVSSAMPIFALFPAMSAVVHAEARGQAHETTDETNGLSPALVALIILQIVLTLPLYLSYGSIFIYIRAAANAISLESLSAADQHDSEGNSSTKTALCHSRPTKPSSSNLLLDPVPSQDLPTKSHCPSTKIRDYNKRVTGGKMKTIGAVVGIAQCMVSITRCIGPYVASSLYTKGLEWEYGPDAGRSVPPPGRALIPRNSGMVTEMDPLSLMNAQTLSRGRLLLGQTVYAVMILLTCLTFVLGLQFPETPWDPAMENEDGGGDGENDDKDRVGEQREEEGTAQETPRS